MMEEVSLGCLAFNQGCDARIAGKSLRANPYRASAYSPEKNAHVLWKRGWNDVHCCWGRYVEPGDRRYKPLPEIVEAA